MGRSISFSEKRREQISVEVRLLRSPHGGNRKRGSQPTFINTGVRPEFPDPVGLFTAIFDLQDFHDLQNSHALQFFHDC